MLSLRNKFVAALVAGATLALSQAQAQPKDAALPTQPAAAAPVHVKVGDAGSYNCESCCEQHCRAWAEFLYISPRNLNLAFALPVDGCDTLVPLGPVAQVSPDDQPTFRVGFEYAVNCNTSVGISYTRLDDSQTETATTNVGVLHSLVLAVGETCPGVGESQAAAASYDFNYDIIDSDVRNVLYSCDNVNIVWLIGARVMRFEQDFASEFSILGSTFVTSNVSLDLGYGPRVGLEGEIGLSCGCSAYAKGAATFLYGNFESTYHQENIFAGVQADTSFKSERVITMLDFEAGVAWTSCDGSCRVALGFMVSQWYNAVTVPGVIQAVQNGNFNRSNDNLNDLIQVEGGVVRVELRF